MESASEWGRRPGSEMKTRVVSIQWRLDGADEVRVHDFTILVFKDEEETA